MKVKNTMKRYINQRGSAHIIVIMVLIVALFGALGVVFYQNFIAKKDDQVKVVAPVMKADTTQTQRIAFNSSIYAIDYPKEWSIKTDKTEGSSTDPTITNLTNPNQTIQVKFTVSDGGIGGTCDVNDGLKISYYKVHSTVVTKLTSQSLYVVEALYDNVGGGYQYTIGLTPDSGATHAAIGDSHCNITNVGTASTVVLGTNNSVVQPTIIAAIKFPKLTKDNAPLKEMQPAKDIISTDDYKAAVKILESARKE